MLANPFSIADPDDAGTMDVVGFDTATPTVMADFARDLPSVAGAPAPPPPRTTERARSAVTSRSPPGADRRYNMHMVTSGGAEIGGRQKRVFEPACRAGRLG